MRYPVGASEGKTPGFDAAGAPQETDAEAAGTNSRDLGPRARWFSMSKHRQCNAAVGRRVCPTPRQDLPGAGFRDHPSGDLDATKLYKTFRDKEDGFIKVVMRPARLIIRSTVRNLLV